MITKRDKAIIKFVEEHGSITINQCSKLFFKGNKEKYDQARKRLRIIHEEGLLKRYRKDPKSEAIYYINNKLKIHDLKLLDVLAELNEFEVSSYVKEKKIAINDNKKYLIDAVMNITLGEISVPLLLEIDYTHYTSIDKIRDVIYFLEDTHKNVGYNFVIVKLTLEDIEIQKIGDYSKLFFLPWNLNNFHQVTSSLRSDIQRIESSFSNT